jgi:hypothetical protein
MGDACDPCPYHFANDCCNPVGSNSPPEVTSPAVDTANPEGIEFIYVASVSDPDCDGTELTTIIQNIPSWCSVVGDTIRGFAECATADTSFRIIVSDGTLADTLQVSVIIDRSNVAPSINEPSETPVLAPFHQTFTYYPEFEDPDDTVHTITYPAIPHWCHVSNDSVVGYAPDTVFIEPLTVVVEDDCLADTVSFEVQVYICGDANGDGMLNVGDAVYMINYIFKYGAPPDPLVAGDSNCDGTLNVGDPVYMINYVFKHGPEPCCPSARPGPSHLK